MEHAVNSRSDLKLTTFPAFFKVEGKTVAVFGNGEEAYAKVRLLTNTNTKIIAYSNKPIVEYKQYLMANDIEHKATDYNAELLTGHTLVFAATADADIDRAIVEAARSLKIPVNAVDQPDYCDFYTPALVSRAPVAVAIGTEGAGPVLAQMIRSKVDQLLAPSLGQLARFATQYRDAADKTVPKGNLRRSFWREFFTGEVAEAIALNDFSRAANAADTLLKTPINRRGYIWLVGAGPGAVDLLTLRAQRVLMQADVIVYDALVPDEIVNMGRRDAQRISVGKRKGCHSKTQTEINKLLVTLGNEGKNVVRLKSGDPLIYGRAAEEMAALRDANVDYEIIPGITSAFAAAAEFELPLTLRGVASSLIFTTGHDLAGDVLPDWASLALSSATIAVYMGRTVAASVALRLMESGLSPETTIAIVENASRQDKRLLHGTLQELPQIENVTDLTGPVMVIIGDAVAGANFKRSYAMNTQITLNNNSSMEPANG